ncbi:MAG: hypothetical protein HY716_05135 [Planctomycetes bacterium]|nr:hypothetical protein [Planctomycetota bacterium]
MDLYTLVFKEDVAVDPRTYGDLLAPILGVTKPEARMAVRRGRGIFVADIAEEAARALAARLEADGAPCWCVPNDALPVLPAPRRVTHLERSDSALRYRGAGAAEPLELAWTGIGVVSVGLVARPEFKDRYPGIRFEHLPALHKIDGDREARDLLREKLILKIGDTESAPADGTRARANRGSFFEELQKKHVRQIKVYADVIAADRAAWLRIPMDEMAYVHETGGIRFGEAFGFHLLMRELEARCPEALTSLSRRCAAGASLPSLVSQTLEEFHRYTSWHVFRNHLRCALPDTSSPSPAPPDPLTGGEPSNVSPAPEPSST